MSFKVPVIDLDLLSGEDELCGLLKEILVNHDTFLLRNYANKSKLDELVGQLGPVDVEQGFDSNFTGTLQLDEDILLEQYIFTTDTQFNFDRGIRDPELKKVYSRLMKIVLYFSQFCLKALGIDDTVVTVNETQHSSKLTRYYHDIDVSNTVLPDGSNLEYEFETAEYLPQRDVGLLSVIPIAQGVRVKPATIGTDENNWVTIEEPECLLLHTGELMAAFSNSMHTTSPIQINPQRNVIQLTLFPSLTMSAGAKTSTTVAQQLLNQEILNFEKVSAEYYPKEYALLKLKDQIDYLRNLFSVSETVISLYAMSRSSSVPPGLHLILPQISNMIKRKVTSDDFLRIVNIWPEAYEVDLNANGDLTVKIPKRDPLAMLTNSSRKLDFVKKLEQWYENAIKKNNIPNSVPPFKINKRRGSDGRNSMEPYTRTKEAGNKQQNTRKRAPVKYLSNAGDKFEYSEKPHDSQENLLLRLREKERRSAALLTQRKNKYEQFLTVKMKQVFEILFSLRWKEPYTSSYLTTLIVDSLQRSNNPIGHEEALDILERLEKLLEGTLIVHTVEGGLKVYRWESLDKEQFYKILIEHKANNASKMDIDI
ncbi:Cell division cycle protein CDT1 [Nakaseomyces bracarensis]|uniref:Cell division cycle protein CDT1 n=1 Tax=Nakaseomyces bracarensis TaxID=273131 RepID=A0ABR4NUD7_9SACH